MKISQTRAAAAAQGRTVLVVENNSLVRRSLVTFVSSLGFRVISVRSAEEALQVAPAQHIHLILAELLLPMRSGIQLIRLLFELGVRPPVILLAGYVSVQARREAADAGVAAVLEKPGQLAELGAALVSLCENSRTVEHNVQ